MRQGWGGNRLRAFYHGLSWSSFGGEPWGRRDKSYDLSEGKLLFQFLLRALHRALMVPWMCLGEKREPTVARPHSLPLFPQRHPEQRNGASLRCQNKLALFPAVQEASSDLVFAKP